MVVFRHIRQLFLLLALFVLVPGSRADAPAYASENSEEVLLTFRYRGVGNVYVTGLYEGNTMFLPVIELFSHLQIFYESSPGDFTLSGVYLNPNRPFRIFFNHQRVTLAGETFTFTSEDFRIGELDYYMSPRVFEEVFGLEFTVNMNNLVLSLETELRMPVEDRAERERSRQLVEAREITRIMLPLEYPRQRKILGGGFADYSITGNYNPFGSYLNYSFTAGGEVLGGDVQGNFAGSFSNIENKTLISGLRWRYVVRETPYFSTLTAGQLITTGLQNRNIRGLSVSNDPIEPRRIYETYVFDGNTEPDSEIELYLNNRLIDFKRADAAGYYRFEFPMTYGTSRLTINIYTPTGETRTIDRQIQIPFTFLPRGEFSYNIQAGYTESTLDNLSDEEQRGVVHGNVAFGVTSWLTARAGVEYLEEANENKPMVYGSLSARLFSQYLLNADIAPDALYRLNASVFYPSSRSVNFSYSHFTGDSPFRRRGAEQELGFSFYTPFELFSTNFGVRLGAEHTVYDVGTMTRYRLDLAMRIQRLNIRMSYRDILFRVDQETSFGQGQLDAIFTYTVQRTPGVPVFARGMFIRANLRYDTFYRELDRIDLQLSRTILQTGRFTFGAGYEIRTRMPFVQLGLAIDLSFMRSSTNVEYKDNSPGIRQNFRGSVGVDTRPLRFIADNRDQVGRSGLSAILFIDNNNSGNYDQGDEIIPARALRLDRSARTTLGNDGFLRITQLQSYYQFNLDVNRTALPNPLLVPGKDRFSFVADPNRLKRIEIPFYRTGIIEGTVYLQRDGRVTGQGGLRLIIKGVTNDFEEVVRNFSDGSYYVMDMPPGKYTVEVDPLQLGFLNAVQQGGLLEFEVQSLSEGDFLEGLDIILVPAAQETGAVFRQEPFEPAQSTALPANAFGQVKASRPAQHLWPGETPESAVFGSGNPAPNILVSGLSLSLPATRQEIQGTHCVLLGLYSTLREADQAREQIMAVAPGEYFIVIEGNARVFALSSRLLSYEEAAVLHGQLQAAGYQESIIREQPMAAAEHRFHIRLMLFDDGFEAESFMVEAIHMVNIPIILEQDQAAGQFALRSPSFDDFAQVQNAARYFAEIALFTPIIIVEK